MPAVDTPVNAVAATIRLILYAIALVIQPVLDAVTLANHMLGGLTGRLLARMAVAFIFLLLCEGLNNPGLTLPITPGWPVG